MNDKIIFIVGPTSSGKTAVSIDLAKKIGGEIICADSRTLYKGLDIGTAKPDEKQKKEVAHWGIDLIYPNESYSVADFKLYATQKIEEISRRNKTPFIVGGSGLYVDSILFDYKFGKLPNIAYRKRLENLNFEELINICSQKKIDLPSSIRKNKRYIIRAIEQGGINDNRRECPIDNAIIIGISVDKNTARERISTRILNMIKYGVIDEAIAVANKYGWDNNAMSGNIYSIIRDYIDGKIDYNTMIDLSVLKDYHLFKRQMTWLKRNKKIVWLKPEKVEEFLLNKTNMLQ
jgi:tRNA dimethylallyltransferase